MHVSFLLALHSQPVPVRCGAEKKIHIQFAIVNNMEESPLLCIMVIIYLRHAKISIILDQNAEPAKANIKDIHCVNVVVLFQITFLINYLILFKQLIFSKFQLPNFSICIPKKQQLFCYLILTSKH